jgi:hypothetical protein
LKLKVTHCFYFYKGEWVADQKHGKGKFHYSSGNTFEGEYLNDEKKQGKYTYKNGSYYLGSYENDKRCGHGTYQWNDGDKYEGILILLIFSL